MEKITLSEKITNEVLESIDQKTLVNNILRHIVIRNCLLMDVIEGEMTEVKGVGRRKIHQVM